MTRELYDIEILFKLKQGQEGRGSAVFVVELAYIKADGEGNKSTTSVRNSKQQREYPKLHQLSTVQWSSGSREPLHMGDTHQMSDFRVSSHARFARSMLNPL